MVRGRHDKGPIHDVEAVQLVEEVAQAYATVEEGIEVFKVEDAGRQVSRTSEGRIKVDVVIIERRVERDYFPLGKGGGNHLEEHGLPIARGTGEQKAPFVGDAELLIQRLYAHKRFDVPLDVVF
jgi:hypothetical protein